MPYISLDNLTQYNGRLRDYIDGSFDKLDGANWRKTSAAQSVSCWPIPESPLEPEVSFKFSEASPESGTKGPDNPSTIVGVESVSCNVCESEGVSDTPYSIDLGGTYYGGTVNFATGVLEVTWGGDVLTGQEEWNMHEQSNSSCSGFYCTYLLTNTASSDSNNETRLVSHFRSFSSNMEVNTFFIGGGSNGKRVVLKYNAEIFPDLNTFTSWLAQQYANGTPVTIAYKLATPITVPLTSVLVRSLPALSHYAPRQNTIYTPHESVQVGYAKSALKTSEELTNAIISLGGNV